MSRNANLSILKPLKKPSLNMLFFKYPNNKPDVESHLGGYPYITKDDQWPICPKCNNDMVFFMQLREVDPNGNVNLKVFYNCRCQIEDYEPIINVIEYKNPKMDKCIKSDKNKKIPPYVEIKLEPSWSIPNWSTLPLYNKEIHKKILEMQNNDNELAEDYYDSLRWNENYLATEPYSLISGYPEFISDPKLFKCNCCNKKAEFVFQLDTDADFQIDWNNGVLYCFRCTKTQTLYFMIN